MFRDIAVRGGMTVPLASDAPSRRARPLERNALHAEQATKVANDTRAMIPRGSRAAAQVVFSSAAKEC